MFVDDRARALRLSIYGWAETDGNVLLVRVAPKQLDAGRWTLPGGGLDFGEHPLQALAREFREETGLVPRILQPLGVHSFVNPLHRTPGVETIQVVQVVYRVAASGSPVNEINGSTVEARWWPVGSLATLPLVELVEVAVSSWQVRTQPNG
jgi:8-oxo-dGTP diphosphatase